jgi:hypothetical protein
MSPKMGHPWYITQDTKVLYNGTHLFEKKRVAEERGTQVHYARTSVLLPAS